MHINTWTANQCRQLTHISSSFNLSNRPPSYKYITVSNYQSSIYVPTNQSINQSIHLSIEPCANPPVLRKFYSLPIGLLTGHTWPYCIPRSVFYSDVFPLHWNSTDVSLRQIRSLGGKDLQPSNVESRKWIGKRRQNLKYMLKVWKSIKGRSWSNESPYSTK